MLAIRQHRPRTIVPDRRGTYLVEFSLVVPVFVLLLLGIMEFGHGYMVIAALNAAAKNAARHGSIEGTTTAQVVARAESGVVAAVRNSAAATIEVKDGTVFDVDPFSPDIDYAALPDIELSTAEERQLFIVRVSMPYSQVSLLPPFWLGDIQLRGLAVMRHE